MSGTSRKKAKFDHHFSRENHPPAALPAPAPVLAPKRTASSTIVPINVKDRWSTEKYKLAEKNMSEVMILKGATAEKPIRRLQLREAASKRIKDSGLLNHLLGHIAGNVTPDGEKRFRRCHKDNGPVVYWLENANLVNIRNGAGVNDPYWVPPPGWRPGEYPIPEAEHTIASRPPNSHWSTERYKIAQKNLAEVMILKGATAEKPITRSLLRAEARKKIRNTGLLDHLICYMDQTGTPDGERRFRRRQNENGTIDLWLEIADGVSHQLLKVDSLYEINHAYLPPETPSQLRSARVAMVSEKTEMSVTVSFPSMDALRVFFSYSNMETHPTLDEKFVMETVLAQKVLYRSVPAEILDEQKSLEGFWLLKSNDVINSDTEASSADDGKTVFVANPDFGINGDNEEHVEKVPEKEEEKKEDENSDDVDENVKDVDDDVEESEKKQESEKKEENEKILINFDDGRSSERDLELSSKRNNEESSEAIISQELSFKRNNEESSEAITSEAAESLKSGCLGFFKNLFFGKF